MCIRDRRRRIHFAEELLEIFQQRSYPSPNGGGGGFDDSSSRGGGAGGGGGSSSSGGPYDSSFVGAALSTRSVYINVPISVERLVIGALGSGSWSGVLETDGSGMVRVSVSASQVVVTPCDDRGVPLLPKKGSASSGSPGEVSAPWIPSATTTGPYLQIPPLFDPSRAAAYFRTLKATSSSSSPADADFNINGYSSPIEPCGSDVESKTLWLVIPTTSPSSTSQSPPPQRFSLIFSDRADRDLFVLLFLYFSMAGRNRSAMEGVLGDALSKKYIYTNTSPSTSSSSSSSKKATTSTVLNSLSGSGVSGDPSSAPSSVAAQSIVAKLDERLEEKAVELMDFPQRELPGCEYSLLTLLSEHLAQNQPMTW
eukprot:TRINITY_DN14221_c0_g1_i1.p1 TRINITY_DN14221_c0_g1~~TRINITY_DN14221_c0_g1_i1.p1  ORF type:complete len:368 (-),score=76.40 TRINITY_DN14221_c0_g1_i1:247-1350(-)